MCIWIPARVSYTLGQRSMQADLTMVLYAAVWASTRWCNNRQCHDATYMGLDTGAGDIRQNCERYLYKQIQSFIYGTDVSIRKSSDRVYKCYTVSCYVCNIANNIVMRYIACMHALGWCMLLDV